MSARRIDYGTPFEQAVAVERRAVHELHLRLAVARARLADSESQTRQRNELLAHVGGLVLEAEQRLAEERAEAERARRSVADAADEEAARIVEAAHAEATALRALAARLHAPGIPVSHAS